MTLMVEKKRRCHPTDWQKFKGLVMPSFGLDAKKLVSPTLSGGGGAGGATFWRALGSAAPNLTRACPGNQQTQC